MLIVLVEEFKEAGAEVTFLKGDVEDTPEGKLLLHMQGAIGEYEKTKIAERTRRGKLHWARQGFLPARIQPFGYTYVPRTESSRATLKIDEEGAHIVRLIFRMFTEDGLTLRSIARQLVERSILTATGSTRWYPSVLRKILSNTVYRGELLYQQTERVKGRSSRKTRTRARPESDWIRIPVPRIVPDKTWYAAQARLQSNREFAGRNAKRAYLLRGLLFCPHCNLRKVGQAKREKRFYRCSRVDPVISARRCRGSSVSADRVETAVWEAVSEALMNPRLLADQYQKKLADSGSEDEFEMEQKQVLHALNRITAQEDRMTDAYRNEAIELDRYSREMRRLKERRSGLQAQLKDLEQRREEKESSQSALEYLERFCQQISAGLDGLDFSERQKLLRLVTERVTVEQDRVRIESVIPTDDGGSGHLSTRDSELDSESLLLAVHAQVAQGRRALPGPQGPSSRPKRRDLLFLATRCKVTCLPDTPPPASPSCPQGTRIETKFLLTSASA